LDTEFYNIKVRGTTDFYICSKDAFDNCLPLANCPLVIELKVPKQLVKERAASIRQAMLQLVCLLTDLQNYWKFFWISNESGKTVSAV
jgi:hypothetical protein